ncbi:MAG: hypothetical protein KDA92_25640, partial [Planctomycetales bacterium]|nr:hypothetical protein [Planctomycetales bacterium]
KLEGDLTDEKKLLYIGEKTISKYGCYACHDISGFEKAKPIGTGLADWGRKDASKLAFEHIAEYLSHGHGHQAPGAGNSHAGAGSHGADASHAEGDENDAEATATAETSPEGDAGEQIDEAFYHEHLMEHDRIGFIWQKLKEPRSYDYAKARNKDSYNDRLRMPLFPFNDSEREAVITFVLGLVAEPPATQFQYKPDSRKAAEIAGHKTLTTFNCAGCHILDPETWTLELPAGSFEEQASDPSQTFPFMPHQFTSEEIAASAQPDPMRGVVTAKLQGMPDVDSADGTQRILDEEGDAIDPEEQYDPTTLIYPFELWQPTLIDGHPYQAGVTPLEVEAKWIVSRKPTVGGDLTKWLLPRAVELEKESNPQADGKQAYGWLPPPLIGEGHKVQSNWLHDFLLSPPRIRPAVLMRMPQFKMSSDEATKLANYFAARDSAVYPYEASTATNDTRLAMKEKSYEQALAEVPAGERPPGDTRFEHAMNIVTSSNYCVQCHIVDDFVPKTSDRAMAPDLSLVNRRLRPEYVKRWLANPKQILPYTPMPVNVKYDANAD